MVRITVCVVLCMVASVGAQTMCSRNKQCQPTKKGDEKCCFLFVNLPGFFSYSACIVAYTPIPSAVCAPSANTDFCASDSDCDSGVSCVGAGRMWWGTCGGGGDNSTPVTEPPTSPQPTTPAPTQPPTSPPSGTAGPADPVTNNAKSFTEEQKQEILNIHNALRAGEGASDMTRMVWDENIASMSQELADKCNFGHSSTGFRRNKFGYRYIGENIWASTARSFSASSVVQGWWDEKSDYDFDTQGCTPGKMCGHYTQVVWSRSFALGCAVSHCGSIGGWGGREGYIVFCNYGEGGNYNRQDPYTKGSACTDCAVGHRGGCYNNMCIAG